MKFDKKKKYIAAVSGGPDSMALLDKYHKNIIGVCHVNYHKRVDSFRDTEIVKKYCKIHHLKLKILDVKKKQYTNSKIHNFQSLARKIRYDFFVKCSKNFKCTNLLVGHNLNDFLETAYMQKKQKSLNLYYGIREISFYKNLVVYRPLLEEFKNDLEKYCKKNKIEYAIDSTNSLDIYQRNKIRKELNKKTKKELLSFYKRVLNRNAKNKSVEKQTISNLQKWEQSKYSLKLLYSTWLNDNFIYMFLKNLNIQTINKNKIKLVKQFLSTKKSNCGLRLEEKIILFKKSGKVFVKYA